MKTLFITMHNQRRNRQSFGHSTSANKGNLVLNEYTGESGCYACAIPSAKSKIDLSILAQKLGNENYEELREKLHTTLCYSKQALTSVPTFDYSKFEGVCGKIESLVGHDSDVYIYASIDSPTADKIHTTFLRHGAVHSFADYNSHVTLDKFTAAEWLKKKASVEEKMQQVNAELASKRLVVEYVNIKIANLKD